METPAHYPIYDSDLCKLEAWAAYARGAHFDTTKLVERVVAECRRLKAENERLHNENQLLANALLKK